MKIIICALLFISTGAIAQFRGGYFGPAFTMASGSYDGVAFDRSFSLDADGKPVVDFTNVKNEKFSGIGAGFMMDMMWRRARFNMDFVYPINGSFKDIGGDGIFMNYFNIGLAFGFSLFNEKVSVLPGITFYANKAKFSPDVSSWSVPFGDQYQAATLDLNPEQSGKFFMQNFPGSGAGLEVNLCWSITDHFIARGTYSYMVTGEKDEPEPTDQLNYESNSRGGKKLELGLNYTFDDDFNYGVFFRCSYWNMNRTYDAKKEYSYMINGSQNTEEIPVPVFPNQNLKSLSFVFGVMFPPSWLGSAEYQEGRIEVSEL